MGEVDSTCWTVVRGAAEGRTVDREAFARRYAPVVRAYLQARWRGTPLLQEVDDAVQDVFVDCFRAALSRADARRPGGFRAFLHGVARNVARMTERRLARRRDLPGRLDPDLVAADEESLAVAFDRAFALTVVRQAGALQRRRARQAGEDAQRRVRLLELRFQEGLPIREIARRWDVDAAHLHREYAKARREFRDALLEVAAFHQPGDAEAAERDCVHLLELFD